MCVALDVEYGNSTYRPYSNLRSHRETRFLMFWGRRIHCSRLTQLVHKSPEKGDLGD